MKIQKKWINILLINLGIVAFIGVLMSYKIGFSFPSFDQKNLQHAHSHFAFSGWVTQALFLFILFCSPFIKKSQTILKYHYLFWINLITAYGMLISFSIQGYGAVSIFFSTTSVFCLVLFSIFYWKDCKGQFSTNYHIIWFKAALGFAVISSLGTFALAYMMATKNMNLNWYLSSVYFYLHFQYNGWFFFACFGLLFYQLKQYLPDFVITKKVFYFFFISCVPAYLLSVLWAHLPIWLYCIAIASAVLQFGGWMIFVRFIQINISALKSKIPVLIKVLFLFIGLAVTVKLLLQLGSTIPLISKLAFGFRPIVIAYLHLVLLVIISLFLITFLFSTNHVAKTVSSRFALFLFVGGVIANECILTLQGILSFRYIIVPYVNEILFGISVLIFSGVLLLIYSSSRLSKADL